MSDYLTREFRAQLTTTMDSVLRRTMFEIMKIFENSLHDHQMELAQKGEEIVQLKIKLQTAEIKLRESECGGDRGAEMKKTQMNETQREPEDVLNPPGQTSDVPEIDFEVPDDWCAPLGCKTVTKQDDIVCPSVKLRPLSIPLWHIPIIKQEVVNRDIDSHQQTKDCRRSKRVSSLNEGHKHTQDGSLPMRDEEIQRPTVRNDMKKLLQDIKQEYTDLKGRPTCLRRKGRHLTGKEQENKLKSKGEQRKIAATESKSTEQETVENKGEKSYSCKFCEKVFDTVFGRSVHVRSHKRCRGCKKDFPFPSALKCHKPYCGKLKKLLAKEARSADPPKPQSCVKEKPTLPSKKQVVITKESTPSSSNHNESSIQKVGTTKKHSCVHCNKKFNSRCKCKEHMRVHTGEKPFPCSMCPKKFRIKQSLKIHTMRIHKDQVSSSETNGSLAWTKPLEETEDNREDLISPSKDTSRAINHNNVQNKRNPDKRQSQRWQTMGTCCSNGFICLLCQKLVRNKYMLIEHFRTHTGERPIKCDRCPAKFRTSAQLCMHKKRCLNPVIQCEKCEKKFPSQTKYDKHVSKCHREWPNICKVCGKGFVTKGRLRNHMERYHK
ncbi:zinc finger protein 605-like [Siniperca chuatsi]|uniref:zinc finger protein 605-like n=1 Tax=Siniperca chuatsi TaxID=119488 RepID=UPI001CE0F141|nr:zinc finger protein 605-like [Siniperca chuatsi]XP_044060152.1 zinc finger protein 605-like [Siniperca chuatsi]XP_044060153.1 zinc finger protein 605-like [Siniperca chuatsi]XP_044060154.1 zinc finger protein 605-like [Siniperca chuatsi]XP_044060155.1 zinc finger protein 605-like [Siniperca chuatsi]